MAAVESPTRAASTFNARQILERREEVIAEITALAASLGEDEVLVCEAPVHLKPLGPWLPELGLELVSDEIRAGVRRLVFHRRARDIPVAR